MGHPGLDPGMYTDDTQMSIALAELLLVTDKDWNLFMVADAFLTAFKRDPRKGYAGRFQAFLEEQTSGNSFVANIIPTSDKSGSSMRSAVMGLIPDEARLYELTQLQAELTHNTHNGVASALAVAYASHFFYYRKGKKEELFDYLKSRVGLWIQPSFADWKGKVKVLGVECVRAAFTALMRNNKISDLLVDCISFTGDVDTVAAIACPIASVCDEMGQDLPQNLIDRLENKAYGRDYIKALDKKLAERFPR
jgi:ADP-ribosylglycohydrolase